MQLKDLRLSDGKLEKIDFTQERLVITVRDWQETAVRLTFVNNVGFDGVAPFDDDLGSIEVGGFPELVGALCGRSGTSPEGQICYAFISAWSEQPVLRVVSGSPPGIERD